METVSKTREKEDPRSNGNWNKETDEFHHQRSIGPTLTIIRPMEREIDRSHEQPEQAISRPFCSLEIAVSSLLSPTIWTTSKRSPRRTTVGRSISRYVRIKPCTTVERWAPVILADAVSRPRRDKSSAGSGGVVAQKPGRREKSIPPRRAPLRDAFGTRANACVRVFARDSRRAERAENESRLRVSSRIWKSHVGEMWNELCRVE